MKDGGAVLVRKLGTICFSCSALLSSKSHEEGHGD